MYHLNLGEYQRSAGSQISGVFLLCFCFLVYFPCCDAETDTDESPLAPVSSGPRAAVDADLLNQRHRETEGAFATVLGRQNLL